MEITAYYCSLNHISPFLTGLFQDIGHRDDPAGDTPEHLSPITTTREALTFLFYMISELELF